VIPAREAVQSLIDGHSSYAALFDFVAKEMTADPLFTFNPDLANVDNNHTAIRFIECNSR